MSYGYLDMKYGARAAPEITPIWGSAVEMSAAGDAGHVPL